MQVSEVYWDFAQSIRSRIMSEVNGVVKFEVFEPIDTVIFKIFFKEFNFSYGISEVQSVVYDGRAEEIVEDILKTYKKTILNSFFKNDDRKKREEAKKLGITGEVF